MTGASPPDGLAELLRVRQAKRVMLVVGPLLDEWDGLPNDVKSLPELKRFRRNIEKLNQVVES